MTTIERKLIPFVGAVLAEANLSYDTFTTDLNDGFDGRRIQIGLNNEDNYSYYIRTWNINDRGIDFTLFKNTNTNANPPELFSGYYSRIFVR